MHENEAPDGAEIRYNLLPGRRYLDEPDFWPQTYLEMPGLPEPARRELTALDRARAKLVRRQAALEQRSERGQRALRDRARRGEPITERDVLPVREPWRKFLTTDVAAFLASLRDCLARHGLAPELVKGPWEALEAAASHGNPFEAIEALGRVDSGEIDSPEKLQSWCRALQIWLREAGRILGRTPARKAADRGLAERDASRFDSAWEAMRRLAWRARVPPAVPQSSTADYAQAVAELDRLISWSHAAFGAPVPPPLPEVGAGAPAEPRPLEIIPGGFILQRNGRPVTGNLSGKPWEVLKAFTASRTGRVTAKDLLATVWEADTLATAQNVKDAVTGVRKALAKALEATPPYDEHDPLPCVDRGPDLAWKLDLG
jgi:hypothetical protein